MRTFCIGLILCLSFAHAPLAAYGGQSAASGDGIDGNKTLRERIPPEVLDSGRRNLVTLTVENDSLGEGTDKNYTSGVRLSYMDITQRSGGLIDRLDELFPFFTANQTTAATFSIGQNLYTPDDISHRAQIPGYRPWAAFLYGSVGVATLTDDHVDDAELTLGVVGPWAQGEAAQRYIHDVMGFADPEGWDQQIENEPGIILSWRRRWPQWFIRESNGLSFAVEPNVGGNLGNVYTLAEGGVTFRLAPAFDPWQDTPLLVRPSIPGSGFFQPQKEKISWYLFGGTQGRIVARNIFLDGNTFKSGYGVDKNLCVLDLNAGAAVTLGNVRVSYTLVYRTKEFDGQDAASVFGGASVGYRF
jgi:lipid A 3-O-deacylase